jgi:uncharacterized protein (TIGR02996 family)
MPMTGQGARMLTDEAFLRAIRANPADDAPWLIYADWLEERGDPRAALYRNRRVTNALGMQLVLVPRGIFWMGRRGNQRQVAIPHEFYLGACPVTQEQWQTLMGDNPSFFCRRGGGAPQVEGISDADLTEFPVEQVSWDDIQQFLKRLNGCEGDSGLLYRLPTEAEWEYACRGGANSQEECGFDFYFSQPTNDLSAEQANFNGKYPAGNAPKGASLRRTTKVGSYQPNRLGLHDMHGNVWEWSEAEGSEKPIRGSAWNDPAGLCTAWYCFRFKPSEQNFNLGFRVAAVPSGE